MDNGMRGKKLMECMHRVPRSMMNLHKLGVHHSAEFLLHELAMPHCFNLLKVAYLVENQDFNCLKGIAGSAQNERFALDNHWNEPVRFLNHMNEASFNQKVKAIEIASPHYSGVDEMTVFSKIAQDLEVQHPLFKKVPIKHDNTGIIIFEPCDHAEYESWDETMEESLYLLGFTPIV